MLHEQVTLMQQLEHRVRNFKRRQDYLWNFSCDICGDSKRDHRKARMYVGKRDNDLAVHCHNCGYSGSFVNYLRYQHPDLAQEYTRQQTLEHLTSAYDINSLFRLEDSILEQLFYVPAFSNKKEWLSHITNKKIKLNKTNLQHLNNIHTNYHK